MRFTLFDLLDQFEVSIPQIQRDYAQGRNDHFELRKSFIQHIRKSLNADEPSLNLDFIYGYTERQQKDREHFIPLDGQQRLTTLWLIHWYLAPRVEDEQRKGNQLISENARQILGRFSYDTRMSSKRFCQGLLIGTLPATDNNSISKTVKDAPWFMRSWTSDPTVTAMLNSLDTIQEEGFSPDLWECITKMNKVTFDYIDIKSDNFRLTDELYIKMNSRGKPLSPFENFKAQFSQLLATKTADYATSLRDYQGTRISYKQYFEFKVDGPWMDLIWRYNKQLVVSEMHDGFLRFIYFIAESLHHASAKEPLESSDLKHDPNLLSKIFSDKANIDFLFDSLDFLSSVEDGTDFFNDLFHGLSTFDSGPNDLFFRALSNTTFEVKDKILLYGVLKYCVKIKPQNADGDFKDYVRILRNQLLMVRQPNNPRRIEYSSNLRFPNLANYGKFVHELVNAKSENSHSDIYSIFAERDFIGFRAEDILAERKKAELVTRQSESKSDILKLEENIFLQGNTTNVVSSTVDLSKRVKLFNSVWHPDIDSSLLTRALLTVGDFFVTTHENSPLGKVFYFGSKGNWNRILTAYAPNEARMISKVIDKFLERYDSATGGSVVEKLNSMIDAFDETSKDWRYYFVRYGSFTNNPLLPLNVFAWSGEGMDIHSLGNSGSRPLHSYHMSPYLSELYSQVAQDERVILVWGRFSEKSKIIIKGSCSLEFTNIGLEIKLEENYVFEDDIVSRYSLTAEGDCFILHDSLNKDRIEAAKEFALEMLN